MRRLQIDAWTGVLGQYLRRLGVEDPRVTWKVLSCSPEGRMVVQYAFFRTPAAARPVPFLTLIGKFYADEGGEQTYQAMRRLREGLSKTAALRSVAIPRPLIYEPTCRLLVQQYVRGIPYGTLVQRGGDETYFRLAGRALALLHEQKVALGEVKRLHDHFHELIRPHPLAFGQLMPCYRPAVHRLMQEMREIEKARAYEMPVVPLHRDFHLRQLFYEEGRVWVVDWDLCAQGDPALDVGNAMVYLQTHLQRSPAAIEAFLDGYCSVASASVLDRVHLYQAFTYLRLACKHFRLQGPHWRERVDTMMLRSEQCAARKSIYTRIT